MQYLNTTAIDAVNNGGNIPDAFYHKSTLIAISKYVKTDGWRGHWELIAQPGFQIVLADWVTGDWDDAPNGNSESEVKTKIDALEAEHGEVWVVFTPTSNVFSTAYEVLIRDAATTPAKAERGKTIAHKTKRFEQPDGSFRVQYHATDVVTYDAAKNSYTLNTGGWNTMTTSKRMTDALPAGWYVYRRNWIMFVHFADDRDDIEITDGMEVHA